MLKDTYNVFIRVTIFLVNLGAHGQETYPNLYDFMHMLSQNTFVHGESSTFASTQLPDYRYRPPGNNE